MQSRRHTIRLILLLTLAAVSLGFSGCGATPSDPAGAPPPGGPIPRVEEAPIPLPDRFRHQAPASAQVEIATRTHHFGERLQVEVSIKDSQASPLAVTMADISGYFQDREVTLSPLIPASGPAVEAQNGREVATMRRYDRWTFVSGRVRQSGAYEFGLQVRTPGGEVISGMATHELTLGPQARQKLAMAALESEGGYNGPPPDYYWQSGAGDLILGSQVVSPGGNLTMTVGDFGAWALQSVSCCFADPTQVYLDGELMPPSRISGGIGGIYNWYGINPLPVPSGPMVKLILGVTGPNHTVIFKLDPQYSGKYFTFTPDPVLGSWTGPLVNLTGPIWSETEGFVILGAPSPSPSPSPSPGQLTITNLVTTPEEFDPAVNTTILTFHVESSGVTNLRTNVNITDANGTVVRTYPQTDHTDVDWIWNGRTDAGAFPGYGDYVWRVESRCDEGLSANATVNVISVPPPPEIVKVTTENGLDLEGDDGSRVSNVYFDASRSIDNDMAFAAEASATPTALPATVQARVSTTSSGLLMKVVLKNKGERLGPAKYLYKVVAPARLNSLGIEQTVANFTVEFKNSDRETPPMNVTVTAPKVVQVISGFEWWYAPDKPNPQWNLDKTTRGTCSVTLEKPKKPYNDERIQIPVLRRACIYATGATTHDEATRKLLPGIFGTLCWKVGGSYRPAEAENTLEDPAAPFYGKQRFNLSALLGRPFLPCQDASNFFQIHCAALGIPMETRQVWGVDGGGSRLVSSSSGRYVTSLITQPSFGFSRDAWGPDPGDEHPIFTLPPAMTPAPALVPAPSPYPPSTYKHFHFVFHQVATLPTAAGEQVWDPTLGFDPRSTPIGVTPYLANSVSSATYLGILVNTWPSYITTVRYFPPNTVDAVR